MATYEITTNDLKLVNQRMIQINIKLEIYSMDDYLLADISGRILSGNSSVDANSSIRRTASISFIPDRKSKIILDNNGYFWIDKKVKLYIGLIDSKTNETTWYKQGTFLFNSASMTYDVSNNQIDLSCSDLTALLDGSANGELGQTKIVIPAYTELLNSAWIDEAKSNGCDTKQKQYAYIYNMGYGDENIILKAGKDGKDTYITDKVYSLCVDRNLSYDTEKQYITAIKDYFNQVNNMGNNFYGEKIYPSITYYRNTDDHIYAVYQNHKIKTELAYVVSQLGRHNNYMIGDIGEPYGMSEAHLQWRRFRETHIDWDYMPYNLEYAAGTNVFQIVQDIIDLYPNYECYMDIDNNFCANIIPSLYNSAITFTNDFMQKILISENTSVNLSEVRNLVHVWGKQFEVDFFAPTSDLTVYRNNTYVTTLSNYEEKYCNGDLLAFVVPGDAKTMNLAEAKLEVLGTIENKQKSMGIIPIYDDNTNKPIDAGVMFGGHTYVFKIVKNYTTEQKDDIKAYLLGEWQAEALAALVDVAALDPNDKVEFPVNSGKKYIRYSEDYFKAIYACPNVVIWDDPDSIFAINKIGERMKVLSGDIYDNIDSVSLAKSNAEYYLWKYARLTDTINITTKICPFADVNIKITYMPNTSVIYKNTDIQYQGSGIEYIVKKISHDWANGTTSWELMRYVSLYNPRQELKIIIEDIEELYDIADTQNKKRIIEIITTYVPSGDINDINNLNVAQKIYDEIRLIK